MGTGLCDVEGELAYTSNAPHMIFSLSESPYGLNLPSQFRLLVPPNVFVNPNPRKEGQTPLPAHANCVVTTYYRYTPSHVQFSFPQMERIKTLWFNPHSPITMI